MKKIMQLSAAGLMTLSSLAGAQIENVLMGVLENPGNSMPAGVNISLASGFVPVLPVLYNEPLNLPAYFANGGVMISPQLAVPAIPLFSAPLAVDGFGELIPSDALPADAIVPSAIVDQLFGAASTAVSELPGL